MASRRQRLRARLAALGLAAALAALVLALALAAGGTATAAPASGPTCAEGPEREGDTIRGTPCADTIVVPESVTRVVGGGGNDTIVSAEAAAPAPQTALAGGVCEPLCGVGSQVFEGGPGDDVVFGERGNDILRGNGGNDRLYGGIGDDILEGGPGNDLLSGGFGADTIDGGEGSDFVRGDGTTDRIYDSGGNQPGEVDTLSYATAVTPSTSGPPRNVPGFPAAAGERGVYLDLSPTAGEFNGGNGSAAEGGGSDRVQREAFETIVGSPFSDFIIGGERGETIYGGGGADVIEGRGGADHLYGGADGDLLIGGSAGSPGDPGDSAAGGTGTDNCLGVEAEAGCEGSAEEVHTRDPGKVALGLQAPAPSPAELYLSGSEGDDEVTATYSAGAVHFTLAGAEFETSAEAEAESGCEVSGAEATCALSAALDSIVLAGSGGADQLAAEGFPQEVGVELLGGEGADRLTGGAQSEDLLVDGRGGGADVLSGSGRDDILIHEGGADQLFGGDGNDLFLSVSTCDGETIDGGGGPYRDNASWARLKDSGTESGNGVDIHLGSPGTVGRVGNPGCSGGTPDTLIGIEDLEGSEAADYLYGDAGNNQLLGHKGPDVYAAGAGEDTILANSGDSDTAIDCGADVDTAIIDVPTAEYADPAPVNCETVRQGAPEEFRNLEEVPQAPPAEPVEPAPVPPSSPLPDTTPPQTRFAYHPPHVVFSAGRHRRVAFRFAASEAGSSFRCQIDRKPYRPCRSPRVFGVSLGRHTVRARAVDAAGNVDRSPAVFHFRVRQRRKVHRHHHRTKAHRSHGRRGGVRAGA